MTKVLIVEDEPNLRREMALLTPWEEMDLILVGEAENGREGLEQIKKLEPHIVVTDIRMPVMDGLEMIAACKEHVPEIEPEWVILSGYTEFEYARKAMKLGVMEYLLKPVDSGELKEVLDKAKEKVQQKKRHNKLESLVNENGENSQALALFHEYSATSGSTASYIARAVELIQARYIGGITIEETAEILGISTGYLSRLFHQETGYTFVDYLMYTRVKKAIELLKDPNVRIYEIADLVGYTDARYFSTVFKRVTGFTPKEFKEGIK